MTGKSLRWVAAAAALTITAGCGHRPPEHLPPPPEHGPGAGENGGPGGAGEPGGPGGPIIPGSRRDFLQSVPSDRVFFALDSYSVDAEAQRVLDAQAQWLNAHPNVRVTIEGHCDERGTREYNLALGDRRANAARNFLQAHGVAAERMNTISWGKERPAVDGHDEAAYAQNRRAVTVVPE